VEIRQVRPYSRVCRADKPSMIEIRDKFQQKEKRERRKEEYTYNDETIPKIA